MSITLILLKLISLRVLFVLYLELIINNFPFLPYHTMTIEQVQ